MAHKVLSFAAGIAAGALILSAQAFAAPASAPIPPELAGTWLITEDAGAALISALDDSAVAALLGSGLTMDSSVCQKVDEDQEEPWLDATGATLRTLTIYCSAKPVAFGLQLDDDSHALMLVDGHYFKAVKNALPDNPETLADHFDMTSFPSSLGPRHLPAGTTLDDLHFRFTGSDLAQATFENQKDGWRFSFTILGYGHDDYGDTALVCVEDQNIGGGNYHTMTPVMFRWNAKGDRLIGSIAPATPRCLPVSGQTSP